MYYLLVLMNLIMKVQTSRTLRLKKNYLQTPQMKPSLARSYHQDFHNHLHGLFPDDLTRSSVCHKVPAILRASMNQFKAVFNFHNHLQGLFPDDLIRSSVCP